MEVDLAALDEERAGNLVHQLLVELAAAREAVEVAERRSAGLRKMIGGVVEMFPATEDLLPEDIDDDEQPRPRGAEAVRRVLEDQAGEWFAVPAIVELLDRRGWSPDSSNPANAVRTAAERLVGQELVHKGRSTSGAVIYSHPKQGGGGGYDPDEEPF